MKILLINHEYPPVGGGAATASANVARYLTKKNNQVEVVTSAFVNLPRIEKTDGGNVTRILSGRNTLYAGGVLHFILFIVSGICFFIKEIGKMQPDIVYAFFTVPAGAIALFLKKVYKIPYFVFLRGMDVPGIRGSKFDFLNRMLAPLMRYIWANADRVIANSQTLKELASQGDSNSPIHVIPNGVDADFFSPALSEKRNKTTKILSVGRLSREKGLPCLFDAFTMLVSRMSIPPDLVIVGDGPEKYNLVRKCARLNIVNQVTFVGWVNRDTLAQQYREADLFITTSINEAMPNTLLEAMACGLPIIASDIPAHKELIENGTNGILVPVQDAKALAEAIRFLIHDKDLRQRISQENLKKVKKYNWDDIGFSFEKMNSEWLQSKKKQ